MLQARNASLLQVWYFFLDLMHCILYPHGIFCIFFKVLYIVQYLAKTIHIAYFVVQRTLHNEESVWHFVVLRHSYWILMQLQLGILNFSSKNIKASFLVNYFVWNSWFYMIIDWKTWVMNFWDLIPWICRNHSYTHHPCKKESLK